MNELIGRLATNDPILYTRVGLCLEIVAGILVFPELLEITGLSKYLDRLEAWLKMQIPQLLEMTKSRSMSALWDNFQGVGTPQKIVLAVTIVPGVLLGWGAICYTFYIFWRYGHYSLYLLVPIFFVSLSCAWVVVLFHESKVFGSPTSLNTCFIFVLLLIFGAPFLPLTYSAAPPLAWITAIGAKIALRMLKGSRRLALALTILAFFLFVLGQGLQLIATYL